MTSHDAGDDSGVARSSDRTVAITSGPIAAVVSPDDGGRLVQITIDGVALLAGPAEGPAPRNALSWGCYPMVPWAGRIRDGRFRFRGRVVDLPRTLGPHAIHGVGFTSPWELAARTDDAVELRLPLPRDARWPFGGTARQRIRVGTDGLHLELSVQAADRAFPASLGWHPWFRKPEAIEFHPSAMYRRDAAGITVDELVAVPGGPWDDCFVNDRSVRLTIDGVTVELSSPCTDWVVFDERAHATCVEPQTAPPDAPNLRPHVLEPGAELTATFDIRPIR
jgi:aldose 1-epimerase